LSNFSFKVLQNIIGNAIKFTHKGKVVITSNVSEHWVDIIVTDTGCGIPASEFEAIFEDFMQVDGTSSRDIGGTGTIS
jgi:signal transduction histidine kinase